jgi:hypothetical protein
LDSNQESLSNNYEFFFNLRDFNQLAMIMGQAIVSPSQAHAGSFAQH